MCEVHYDNGHHKYKGFFEDGLLNGECEEYWDNGNLKFKGFFIKGIYNGEGILYHR